MYKNQICLEKVKNVLLAHGSSMWIDRSGAIQFVLYRLDVTLLEINKTSFFLKKHKRGFVTLL